jgi:hypothetical protein
MKVALTIAVLLLAGCASAPHQSAIGPKLLGTWRAANKECQDDFTFSADGKFTLARVLTKGHTRVKGSGTWRLEGNLLAVRFDPAPIEREDSEEESTEIPPPGNFIVAVLKIEPDTLITTQMGSADTIVAKRLR